MKTVLFWMIAGVFTATGIAFVVLGERPIVRFGALLLYTLGMLLSRAPKLLAPRTVNITINGNDSDPERIAKVFSEQIHLSETSIRLREADRK